MRRMTTGFVIEPFAQCRSCWPISTTSAFAFSNSTVARRTVQTLIGSYVALRTSTRPPDQRPEPSGSDPCRRWSSSGTDPSGAGGTPIAGRSVAKVSTGTCRFWRHRAVPGRLEPGGGEGGRAGPRATVPRSERRCGDLGGPVCGCGSHGPGRPPAGRYSERDRGRERAEDADRLAVGPQACHGVGDRRIAGIADEVAEEHVVGEPDPPRARLDPRQVDLPRGELAEAGDEPARRPVAGAPEDESRLRRLGGAGRRRGALDLAGGRAA